MRATAGRRPGAWGLLLRHPLGAVGLGVIALYAALALAHPLLMAVAWDPAVYDPVVGYAADEAAHPAAPSLRHPLGTDPLGRDVLSQLMVSARTELALGLLAALVTLAVATTVGATAAYIGGVVDAALMRLADLVVMLPTFAFLVLLGALVRLDLVTLAAVVGLLSGLGGAAIMLKAQALSITVRPFVEAARATGAGHGRIIVVHIMPNLLPLALLSAMFTVTAAVFAEAALSFFGVLTVSMSWGIMLHTAQTSGYLLAGPGAWWLVAPAGLSVTLLCGSFYLVGRALDEVVDPRLRG